jgi:3-methylfumaryl-CoA hydratase
LPPLWHWFYFLQAVPRGQLGIDGHPRLPGSGASDVPPRRMFAAARIQIDRPLCLGERASMSVAVVATRETTGSSGPLRIVTFEHRYQQQGQLCIIEQRDIVYRSGGFAGRSPGGATIQPVWRKQVTPDAAMLMRMSALTFNAHRIHYDQHYAQHDEGYPERVVHAPLTALLLAEQLRASQPRPLRRLEFRARSPLFIDQPMELLASPAEGQVTMQAIAASGLLAMEASARL